jgi:ankyrin repeat protein
MSPRGKATRKRWRCCWEKAVHLIFIKLLGETRARRGGEGGGGGRFLYRVFISLFISCAVRVDDRDAHGDTPLHLAVKASGLEIASMLLMAKANPRVNDAQGLTPLAGAVLALRGPAVAHLFHRHGLWLGEQQLARVSGQTDRLAYKSTGLS